MPNPNDHRSHDPALIAAHAAGDLIGAQRELADRMLAACEDCARLHADIRAIAAATHALPAIPTATAPRDFRITPDQAARLRRGSLVRRLLRPFASPSSSARPLAAAFSGLGAIGLAIVLLLPVLGGTASLTALSGAEDNAYSGAAAGPTAAPQAPQGEPVPGAAVAEPSAGSPRDNLVATAQPGGRPPAKEGENGDASGGTDVPTAARSGLNPASLVLVGSLVLLVIGVALFLLRILARRVA